jgi:hypothetical protein
MKTPYVILGILAVYTTLLAGPSMTYDNTKSPGLSLPAAYEIATHTLGSATNQFYCSGAGLANYWGKPMWSFSFSTTNSSPNHKVVWVYFDGSAQFPPLIER